MGDIEATRKKDYEQLPTVWPDPGCPPHVYNPRANYRPHGDPLSFGCCQWRREHPVHVIDVTAREVVGALPAGNAHYREQA